MSESKPEPIRMDKVALAGGVPPANEGRQYGMIRQKIQGDYSKLLRSYLRKSLGK